MKIYFLDPTSRASINIRRLKRLSYPVQGMIVDRIESLDALVVLGNASPEDEIIGIVSCHQRNDLIFGISKPERHHVDAFRQIKTYLSLRNFERFLFVIDQDEFAVQDVFRRTEEVFEEQGVTFSVKMDASTIDKVRLYSCSVGQRSFCIVIAISGLEDFVCEKHVIENHLSLLAGISQGMSAKDEWASLSTAERENILELLKDKDIAEVVFPQLFLAFDLLVNYR